ncbi:NADH-quinone oxidoreductase subunit M [Blochmannia endosymbiont of Camponotus sp. C-003]|uniref:NADH-quinone oxidoreductase subunit M n=1 Tax=unclassified Candidatus Blochmanniella TaxID=711328 RepID=UPI00202529F5|nr:MULTISPECIES: NADH-quinone oxidoreductase subunit M [unclassified Candidatus Blochmannia]URJ23348.1 NADH-quinone oxidoreductase subunit M [Blochmannia endosymbiont of Camponotus sp. C-003]URJ28821.1 NADH-quinone oxidoreductase subunit M [Blochmannia endosymbiont of Camponotus sp. C-046]
MLLVILILIPLIFGLLCWQSERIGDWVPRWVALSGMSITLITIVFLWKYKCHDLLNVYPPTEHMLARWQLEYIYPWVPRFGISVHLALDGFSLLMVTLTGLLGCMAVLCSWCEIQRYQGLFYLNLLWILGGVIGVFLSIDMFLFFFFWEIMLIPMYFLISLWGHQEVNKSDRINTAIKFVVYTQFSGLFMLLSIITLVSINHDIHGVWSFNYQDLLNILIPVHMEYLIMLGFFFAFAVKMPIVPFHVWLPDVHGQAPTAGSVDLAGILIKTAAYGFFRFVLPLFPCASKSFAPIAMCLGLLNIFYGAFMAFAQTDCKRLIAYTSISHMGFVLIAIYSGAQLSYQGAVIQMISHSLSVSGMFILCGQLYERTHTRDMRLMGGLWSRMHLMPAFSLCLAAATLGLPGTGNFIGEITILFGNFRAAPITTIIASFGIILSSIYSLILMQRIYYGPISISSVVNKGGLLQNMTLREKNIIIIILLCIFLIGFFPQYILNTSYMTMHNLYVWLQEHNCSM